MNNDDITIFAETNYRNQKRRFGIKRDDRRRHMYLIGKTGMGKSTMLENMIIDDIRAGKGVAVVDPHGDLIEKVINYIPSRRVNDVVNFDPSDMDFPIAFNPLESIDPRYKHLICSGLISVFKKLWADSWGPRLEYLLRNAILALLDTSGTTLLGIMRLLVDKSYRKKIIDNIKDPVVKAFWVDEYSKYPDKFQVEAISPIQNKVGQFLSNFLIRNIVGQVKSSFDMREVMDNEKILLVNLSKGRIGEDTSGLLGSMIITKIQLSAMDRINIPEEERKDFYLYVDEFQNFATDSFATILSEARKYHLNLIMAHQYIEQLNEVVCPAVFGNVGTMVLFRVGATDAEQLVKEFTPKFIEEDLVNIPKWECYMKLMVDGIATDPFSANGLPPLMKEEITNNREKVINLSRERYAEKREIVEEKIARWSGTNIQGSGKSELKSNNQELRNGKTEELDRKNNINNSNSEQDFSVGYDVVCSNCGKETVVKFKPDGVRSIFCKECLKKFKKGELRLPSHLEKPCLRRQDAVPVAGVNPLLSRSGDLPENNKIKNQEVKETPKPKNIAFVNQATRLENDPIKKQEFKHNLKPVNAPIQTQEIKKNTMKEYAITNDKEFTEQEKKLAKNKNFTNESIQKTEDRERPKVHPVKAPKSQNYEEKEESVSLFSALKKGAVDFRGKRIVNSVFDIEEAKKEKKGFTNDVEKKNNLENNHTVKNNKLPQVKETDKLKINNKEKTLSKGEVVKF